MFFQPHFSIIPLVLTIVILSVTHNNGVFHPPIFNFLLDLGLRLTTSFMVGGGFILYTKCLTKTPFFRTSRDNSSDFVDTICSRNVSNSSLPFSMLEDVDNENMAGIYEKFYSCCALVLLYSCCLLVEFLWRRKHGKSIKELISLATSVMLPNDNREERKTAIVQLMMNKVRPVLTRLIKHKYMECSLIIISFFCFIFSQLNYHYSIDEYFHVQLSDSEWIVDCSRQPTSQDLHILKKCHGPGFDCEFKSISIIPIDHTYFHLRFGLLCCSTILLFACAARVLYKFYKIKKLGSWRVCELLLVKLLKINVDYNKHKEIIDAFERQLGERVTWTTRPNPSQVAVYNRATEAVYLDIYTPD